MSHDIAAPAPEVLALAGGRPVRDTLLPYGRHAIDDDDVDAVVRALRSDWLTTGPRVAEFEAAFAGQLGARHAVAVSSGTAALHAAMHAIGVGPGDEVVVPTLTFVATANCAVYEGARPVFCDVDPGTLLAGAEQAAAHVGPHTRAIVAVDYAGQACAYGDLRALARESGARLVADACHALGGSDADGCPVGTLAELSTFSLHPVKALAAGEGGVVTTADPALARAIRRFRDHGLERERGPATMTVLGRNYRLPDIACALATSQLAKLEDRVRRRRALAGRYDEAFATLAGVQPLALRPGAGHARHLYVLRLECDRDLALRALRAEGIGATVHFPPVHLHPYYRQRFGTRPGQCPVAEDAAGRILSLPLFPTMTDGDADAVIEAVDKVVGALT